MPRRVRLHQPWNFLLAIFAGQVAAALVTGNTVAAKPAEQTPAWRSEAVEAAARGRYCRRDALVQLLHGPVVRPSGGPRGSHRRAPAVFTGSTVVAKIINRTLAAKDGARSCR